MTDRHPDKQNGMTIRLTLCERDAILIQENVVKLPKKLPQLNYINTQQQNQFLWAMADLYCWDV